MEIELFFKEYYDLELLEKGFNQRLLRLFANCTFRFTNSWSGIIPAIIDTGSPLSVLPEDLWKKCEKKIFTSTKIRGMVPDKKAYILTYYGEITCAFVDSKHISREYKSKAFLSETSEIPVIIGFADLIDKVKLIVDYPEKKAWLNISAY